MEIPGKTLLLEDVLAWTETFLKSSSLFFYAWTLPPPHLETRLGCTAQHRGQPGYRPSSPAGSTGEPKGVMLTHLQFALQRSPGDAGLHAQWP